ncbi:HEAT repeat domain-containing protein [Streptomyces sp. CMB-StM0423]|uniref:HEAT repeat domain-containing protein n=1 Tax=Streptomyces sp. CMB-StM0423 TaxID=2059884 RepID=UPI000C715535|nr:HEAT repeat domain-containing protein [Streptomyces sp. CMB-StM0423]AUH39697.1 PBS lyase [Streptomyces sp. CMB-StM0423]
MDQEYLALTERIRGRLEDPPARARFEHMTALARQHTTTAHEELARVLELPGEPLWARELAAFALGTAGDRRAFETLVLLLNYRDPVRAESAACALARLGDPRTARAAAALATNPLRTAYALHAIRLLVRLRAPESAPALISTLHRLVREPQHHWPIATACVEGLGELGDPRAIPALSEALGFPQLWRAATAAITRIGPRTPSQ